MIHESPAVRGGRGIWPRAALFATLAVSLACLGLGAGEPPPVERPTGAVIAEMIDIYCIDCHSGSDAKGQLGLRQLQRAAAVEKADPSLLLSIRDRLRARDMPPVDPTLDPEDAAASRPDEGEYAAAIADLGAVLRDQAATAGVPPVVVRRLNRVAYRNAVRDLLG
ncbi:MAG: hypothetical protein MK085_01645, partial [Phycisphaerales bacterium]|nr:hypothetical protein [Phycisphaerales bacterium]